MSMKKILIVDDEPHVSMILKQFLERSNYQVITALNGQQALAKIAKEMPDLLITDVQMPKMNGIDLCEEINRNFPSLQKLIIVMTSRTDSEIRTWVAPHAYIELMEKPLSMRRLTSRINDFFCLAE
jgi:DNA-binding response OmpR family regulator